LVALEYHRLAGSEAVDRIDYCDVGDRRGLGRGPAGQH